MKKMFNVLYYLLSICVCTKIVDCILSKPPELYLTMTEIITKNGYPAENHTIVTEDGYILTTFRIPHGINSSKTNKNPVLLVHGMSGCSENFIAMGAENSIAYYLADNGYDVWLCNVRGNFHSRKHQIYNPDTDKRFWNYSFHEMGIYDMTANIDYILNHTNESTLYYLGHSQGGTIYFVMTSERPEYNSKIRLSLNFAPSIVFSYIDAPFAVVFAKYYRIFQYFFEDFEIYELFPNNNDLIESMKIFCSETVALREICRFIIYFIGGDDTGLINQTSVPLIMNKLPAGVSAHQAIHYMQGVNTGYFRKYDYGIQGNLKMYNQTSPPMYNLKTSTAPVALVYGKTDWFVPPKGMRALKKILPNVVMDYEVPREHFNHVDFIFAYNIMELVNKPVLKIFNKYKTN